MKTLRQFIEENALGAADAEARLQDGLAVFGAYLPASANDLWLRVLSKFTRDIPLRYWDQATVKKALLVLELDEQRTVDALAVWKYRLGTGFDYLFRRAAIEKHEDDLSTFSSPPLLLLSNEFHPEYLRRCEHIFGNLLIVYWAALKQGAVEGSFGIKGAAGLLRSKGYELLLSGYDEKVRNAIAHGQVTFGLSEIQYRDRGYVHKLQDDEFLYLFDTLWRTSNSLAIAILLFMARNPSSFSAARSVLPTSVMALIAASQIEREGLSLRGAIESETSTGRQLHILMETIFKGDASILLECSQIALRLLDAGAAGYDRYLFGIHQRTSVDSMVGVLPRKLIALANEPYTRLPEILDFQLIWTNESVLQYRVKAFRIALVSNFRLAWARFVGEQQRKGLFRTTNRYYIREVKNSSAAGIARVHVVVTLRFASDAADRDMVKRIVEAVLRRIRRRVVTTNPSNVRNPRWNWHKRPKYIWVSLYRYEGTKRWVVYGGWLQKNLILAAEKIYDHSAEPLFVKKVDEIWKGIRLQYSIDAEAAARSHAEILEVAHEIKEESSDDEKR